MSPFFHIHAEDGRHAVCMTTNGLDHERIPTAAFGKPRDAIRYADMRQRMTSPLRDREEAGTPSPASPRPLTRPAQ